MLFSIAADIITVFHLCFIIFVIAGGLPALRYRRLIFLHLPAAAWGALIEFKGWICPLTPLEQQLRQAAANSSYQGSFIEHYLLPIIYPSELTRELQIFFGVMVVIVNLAVYGSLLFRSVRRH
ncbi:MAG: hypothetical protein BM485_10410 [Desulfobulbaceae bacterium DB1]|nr:MAG: hypothetical protein BM485_10410 [Desulfobulbaceae bacterium DB1]